MDFLYLTVMLACSLIAAVSGKCDVAGVTQCSGEGIPTCETLPAIQQCLKGFASDCSGNAVYESLKTSMNTFKSQCQGGSSCDVVKLSECMTPLQASIAQLSSGSQPNSEMLQAMCSGYNQFKACKPASCDNSPLLQSMAQHTAMLDSTCGGSGGSSGGSGDCSMQEMNTCLQPLNAMLTSMPKDGTIPSGPELDNICSTFKTFQSCLPPACANNEVIKGMQQQSSTLNQMCREGCKLSEIMTCVRPLMDLHKGQLSSLEFNSVMINSVCQVYATYKSCINANMDESCKKNSQFKEMATQMEKVDRVHNYMCVSKKAEIMKHKDCFDKPEVGMVMKQCYDNHTKSMMAKIADPQADNRPSDTKICNAINLEATCVKNGIGDACTENTKDSVYKISRGGMMLLTSLSTCEDGTSGSNHIQMSLWATIMIIVGAVMF